MLNKEQLAEEFENFLNENGLFLKFKDWAENRGYEINDFGMLDE